MSRRRLIRRILAWHGVLLLTLCSPVPASAQSRPLIGTDIGFLTRYVWRGVTRHDGPVFHTDLLLSYWNRSFGVTGGLWGNISLSGANELDRIGFGQTWLGETNAWLEVSGTVGPAFLAGGMIGYFFDTTNASGPTASLENTHEVYARLELPSLPVVVPRLATFVDVDAVGGIYFEPGLTVRVPIWVGLLFPAGSLFLDAAAGFSFGQEYDDESGRMGYYAGSGLTHLDLSAAINIGRMPLGPFDTAVRLDLLHIQINRDPSTKVADPGGERRGVTAWFGVTFTLLGPECRPEKSICATGR